MVHITIIIRVSLIHTHNARSNIHLVCHYVTIFCWLMIWKFHHVTHMLCQFYQLLCQFYQFCSCLKRIGQTEEQWNQSWRNKVSDLTSTTYRRKLFSPVCRNSVREVSWILPHPGVPPSCPHRGHFLVFLLARQGRHGQGGHPAHYDNADGVH